jgi:hypothetical protein
VGIGDLEPAAKARQRIGAIHGFGGFA